MVAVRVRLIEAGEESPVSSSRARARDRRPDWSAVVMELRQAGLTHAQIGDECDADKTWVHRLLNIPGTQPKFHEGMLLLGLWMQTTGKEAEALPRL